MRRIALYLVVLVMSPLSRAEAAKPLEFHVSPKGKDSAPGTATQPFATLARAQQAVRAKLAEGTPTVPLHVVIAGGVYELDGPLVFTSEDSGTSSAPVVYRAAKGAKPVISGGQRIVQWRETKHNNLRAWVSDVPGEPAVRQLFVNSRRRPRTRLPKEGFYQIASLPQATTDTLWHTGQTQAEFAGKDLQPWTNLTDVEVMGLHLWSNSRLPLVSVDPETRLVTFGKTSVFRLTDDNMGVGNRMPGSRYWVENVYEALEGPGQWYHDRPNNRLIYLPLPRETRQNTEIIVARLPELVRFDGAAHVHLHGLALAHQEWMYGPDKAGSPQADVFVPGAVVLRNAAHCGLHQCSIAHIAGYAVELLEGCTGNRITRCRMTDLGAGGVKIGHDSSRTTVADCEIIDGGILFPSAVGVWIGSSGDNTVIHNHIAQLYYTGISLGWTWGYGPSGAVRNRIEYNHIHDIGRGLLSDMGGIYSLGISPGTVLRGNVIHDITSHTYGGWGLYTDEGSSGMLLEQNLVYRTKSAGFHQHYGRENVVRNNIFLFGGEAGMMRTRREEHLSLVFERNIVVSDNGRMVKGGGFARGNIAFINNLYYVIGDATPDFAGLPFNQWQAEGFDYQSRFADPRFVNLREGDYRLRKDSPAIALGFVPFDPRLAGPRKPGKREE